jgi:phage recombination protein Bet
MSNELMIIPDDKIQLVKDQICRGASDGELQLFIATCNRTKLDPFSKQCWAVKRWDSNLGREVMTFQTGVDGFRVIAARSEKYAGQVGPYWCGPDGVWKDVWLDNIPPIASKVGVLRTDFKEPLWAVAKFSSYAGRKKDGNLTPFWFKMPELMISKVAECLALRKAFPQDLSGIYSTEEMDQAVAEKDATPALIKPNEKDFKRMAAIQAEIKENKPAQVETIKVEQQTILNQPAQEPTPKVEKPIVNHAVPTEADIDKYKTNFNFGTYKVGTTFADLGVSGTKKMQTAIMSYALSLDSAGKEVPVQLKMFLDVSKLYLERHER